MQCIILYCSSVLLNFLVNKYGLLTKCEVKMAGYILAKFFFYVFMDRDEVEVHKLAKKKNEANSQPSWPNKLGQ